MKRKCIHLLIISILTTTASFAEIENMTVANSAKFEEFANHEISRMSTMQLQEEVEKRTNAGMVPFEMGVELIRRWTER